jgi:ketol-acid reductoisomerase
MNVYTDDDINRKAIQDKRVAVIGYGSQGRAQAANLRDSGLDVIVGTREGPSRERAQKEGFATLDIPRAVVQSDIVMMLIPDEAHAKVYKDEIDASLVRGAALGFAHGFSVHYGLVLPKEGVDVFLVAPLGPGAHLRELYLKGSGLPCQFAVGRDATGDCREIALSYAHMIGCTRVGAFKTTFTEEAETDLFGEQAVLCGGLMQLVTLAYETLTEAGYSPESAWFESLYQVRLLADLVEKHGVHGMLERISQTALYGALTRGPRIIGEEAKEAMRQVLKEIKSGRFAEEWTVEAATGKERLRLLLNERAKHPIEAATEEMRRLLGDET